jgi:hypothetical protein
MDETPSKGERPVPPWVRSRPELFRRRGFVDQLQETTKRVKKALHRAYQGDTLSDKQIRGLVQVVLLDLLSSHDPLARAVAASELVSIQREHREAGKDRILRTAKKRELLATPPHEQAKAAEDFLSEFFDHE